MPNMSYCRFENTFHDLKDCYDNWNDADSESELRFQEKLLKLANKIVFTYYKQLNKDVVLADIELMWNQGLLERKEYEELKLKALS